MRNFRAGPDRGNFGEIAAGWSWQGGGAASARIAVVCRRVDPTGR